MGPWVEDWRPDRSWRKGKWEVQVFPPPPPCTARRGQCVLTRSKEGWWRRVGLLDPNKKCGQDLDMWRGGILARAGREGERQRKRRFMKPSMHWIFQTPAHRPVHSCHYIPLGDALAFSLFCILHSPQISLSRDVLRHRCREQMYGHQGGKTAVGWGWWCAELDDWDWHVYSDVYKIDDWLKK